MRLGCLFSLLAITTHGWGTFNPDNYHFVPIWWYLNQTIDWIYDFSASWLPYPANYVEWHEMWGEMIKHPLGGAHDRYTPGVELAEKLKRICMQTPAEDHDGNPEIPLSIFGQAPSWAPVSDCKQLLCSPIVDLFLDREPMYTNSTTIWVEAMQSHLYEWAIYASCGVSNCGFQKMCEKEGTTCHSYPIDSEDPTIGLEYLFSWDCKLNPEEILKPGRCTHTPEGIWAGSCHAPEAMYFGMLPMFDPCFQEWCHEAVLTYNKEQEWFYNCTRDPKWKLVGTTPNPGAGFSPPNNGTPPTKFPIGSFDNKDNFRTRFHAIHGYTHLAADMAADGDIKNRHADMEARDRDMETQHGDMETQHGDMETQYGDIETKGETQGGLSFTREEEFCKDRLAPGVLAHLPEQSSMSPEDFHPVYKDRHAISGWEEISMPQWVSSCFFYWGQPPMDNPLSGPWPTKYQDLYDCMYTCFTSVRFCSYILGYFYDGYSVYEPQYFSWNQQNDCSIVAQPADCDVGMNLLTYSDICISNGWCAYESPEDAEKTNRRTRRERRLRHLPLEHPDRQANQQPHKIWSETEKNALQKEWFEKSQEERDREISQMQKVTLEHVLQMALLSNRHEQAIRTAAVLKHVPMELFVQMTGNVPDRETRAAELEAALGHAGEVAEFEIAKYHKDSKAYVQAHLMTLQEMI